MTPREFRQEQGFEFDHFLELTSTGIKPNYANIELFAHEYHRAKLKLLGVADVVGQSEQLSILDRCECEEPKEEPIKICMNCNGYIE